MDLSPSAQTPVSHAETARIVRAASSIPRPSGIVRCHCKAAAPAAQSIAVPAAQSIEHRALQPQRHRAQRHRRVNLGCHKPIPEPVIEGSSHSIEIPMVWLRMLIHYPCMMMPSRPCFSRMLCGGRPPPPRRGRAGAPACKRWASASDGTKA